MSKSNELLSVAEALLRDAYKLLEPGHIRYSSSGDETARQQLFEGIKEYFDSSYPPEPEAPPVSASRVKLPVIQ